MDAPVAIVTSETAAINALQIRPIGIPPLVCSSLDGPKRLNTKLKATRIAHVTPALQYPEGLRLKAPQKCYQRRSPWFEC